MEEIRLSQFIAELSMRARNFGSEKIVRTGGVRPYVRPLLHVSRGEIWHFKQNARFGGKSYSFPAF